MRFKNNLADKAEVCHCRLCRRPPTTVHLPNADRPFHPDVTLRLCEECNQKMLEEWYREDVLGEAWKAPDGRP